MSSFFQEAIHWDIPEVVEFATLIAARFSTILWFVVAITVVTKAITYLSGLLMGGSQPSPPGQVVMGGSTSGDEIQRELLSDIRSELKQQREETTSGRAREFKFPRGRRRR